MPEERFCEYKIFLSSLDSLNVVCRSKCDLSASAPVSLSAV